MTKHALTAVLGLFLLSGCAPKVAEWTPAESPKKNLVQRATREHVVRYPAHWSSIPKCEKKRLNDFIVEQLRDPDATQVYLTEFGGENPKRLNDIVRVLRLAGMRQSNITIDGQLDELTHRTGSGVVILVERFLVVPPSCDAWTHEMGSAQGHLPMRNIGCATATNLGMMIADPRDLVVGKDVGLYDGTRHALSVQKYREDDIKELKIETTSSAGGGSGGAE